MPSPTIIADRGEQIYREKYRAEYETNRAGQYLAIDIESELAYFGATPEAALEAARTANQKGVFHLIRVGAPGVFRTAYSEAQVDDWVFGR